MPYPVVWQLLEARIHERSGGAHLAEDARQLVALACARQQGPTRSHFREDASVENQKKNSESESVRAFAAQDSKDTWPLQLSRVRVTCAVAGKHKTKQTQTTTIVVLQLT